MKQYEYLWDGTAPGWVVICVRKQELALSLVFSREGPSVQDIKAIRSVLPEYSLLSATAVMSRLRGKALVDLGSFESREGRRIVAACREKGLAVQELVQDGPVYHLFNEQTKRALIIEDDLLAKEVLEAALNFGMPVKEL
ncbi:hypothetical protein [Chromobacterium sp. IRSSSOUMB001]|uniref:hypothetical protein n=1 Tax=Chromobacterium sp. IRSSSOUMB001 TaxID=2927123 RepID=UPI0020C10A91|nr:hypothetical protein [Chromobacterium sp. IRSSSOUMB001]